MSHISFFFYTHFYVIWLSYDHNGGTMIDHQWLAVTKWIALSVIKVVNIQQCTCEFIVRCFGEVCALNLGRIFL